MRWGGTTSQNDIKSRIIAVGFAAVPANVVGYRNHRWGVVTSRVNR